MRERLIYLLKHNGLFQRLYRAVAGGLLRLWGRFVPLDDELALFVSFMGKGFNDSPRAIYDEIRSQSRLQGLRLVWAFEEPARFANVESVRIDTLAYFRTALRARYWITNTNIERGLRFKKRDQVYLNTWHGIALKHIGNDCPGRKDFDFRHVNYLVVNGAYDEKVFASAFRAPASCYLRCGLPRNEALWRAGEAERLAARGKLGIPAGKKVVLYAPTWRESTDGGKSYALRPPVHFDRWKAALGEDYVVLFRAHHQTTRVLGVCYDEFVRDASDYPDVNDLMIASDALVTDYSAIAFDFSILLRPILCYTWDMDSYLAERGAYFDMDEWYPNPCCRTEEALLARLSALDPAAEREKTRRFRDHFIEYAQGSTRACVQALFGE